MFSLIKSASSDGSASKNLLVNQHLKYFYEYLNDLGAKTIVLESRYIDHDYLEDYAGYYVRCFNRYRRTTSRLHFFSKSFSSTQFRTVILKSPQGRLGKQLDKNYLGFMVLKPLPQTIVGRTCFKTYPNDGNRRHFPTLHKYCSNLFGLPLSVDSLAYQEQDKVVAACATSALWSVFQGSGKIFHHPIPSPVEITKAASLHIPDAGLVPHDARSLHHSGLTPTQIAHGVRSVGMEPYLVGASNEFVIKTTAYAYLKAKIPALLGISLVDESIVNDTQDLGKHAVAITGYSLGHPNPIPYNNGILIAASRIDKVYVHDDQIGPFAKMVFSANNRLKTDWLDSTGKRGGVLADPFMLVIPLYHKIRIPYQIVFDRIAEFDVVIEALRVNAHLPVSTRLEWDIYLTDVNEVKKEISKLKLLDKKIKQNTLLSNMPKYLWRATGIDNGVNKLDVLFDATDIEQGTIIVAIVVYDSSLKKYLELLNPVVSEHSQISESVKMLFEKISYPTLFKPIE